MNMKELPSSSRNPSIDLPQLLERVEQDRELLCELLSIFHEEFPGRYLALQDAVAKGDAQSAVGISHALKGMLSNLAMTKASASAARLEQAGRAGNRETLREAYVDFAKTVEGLLPEVESYLAEAGR